MFKLNNEEYRNLEEQVLENKQKIAEHYNIDRVLADFGIKVLGQVNSEADLPDPAGDFDYGDAYAVGTAEPYSFYIYTRPDPNGGHESNWWFNIGQLAIIGPQGPQGEKGDKGDIGKSSIWYASETAPSNGTEGDMWLDKTGRVSRFTNGNWVYFINITGPQGIQGPKGDKGDKGDQGLRGLQGPKGDPGKGPHVVGELSSVDLLPTPTESIRDNAYIISGNLYMIQGDTTLTWKNYGTYPVVENSGTTITINGVQQTSYDATDVYNNKITNTSLQVLTKEGGVYGSKGGRPFAAAHSIPLRGNKGQLQVFCDDSSEDRAAVNKEYMNTKVPIAIKNKLNETPRLIANFDNDTEIILIQNSSDTETPEWSLQGNKDFFYYDNNLTTYYYVGKIPFGLVSGGNIAEIKCNYDSSNTITITYNATANTVRITNTIAGTGEIYIL